MIIDQLPTIANVQNSDELPIERGQTTYKTTVGAVIGAVSKIVADDYDNSSTYTVGDYCIYEGTLYVCNTDISTAEEWNATHWTATNVTDEIPSAYTSNPAMDGTASPGSSSSWAKGDHVHPHDSSKADTGLGITGATVGKVPVISAVDGNGVPTAFDAGDGGDVTADMLGIVITGARPAVAVTAGQYVIVRSSTITGITDGLYTAVNALSPSTDVTAADLTPVSGGGLNKLWDYVEKTLYANIPPVAPVTIGAHQYGSYKTTVPMNVDKVPIQRYMGGGLMTDFTETNGCFDFTIFNPSDNAITPTVIWFYLI